MSLRSFGSVHGCTNRAWRNCSIWGEKGRSRSTVVGAGKKQCTQPVLAGCVSDTGPGPVINIVLLDFKSSENLCVLQTYQVGWVCAHFCCVAHKKLN